MDQHTQILLEHASLCAFQSTEAASSAVVTSPSKPTPSRQASARSLEHANSTDSNKKGLMAAVPKAAVRRGGFKVNVFQLHLQSMSHCGIGQVRLVYTVAT